HAAGAAAVSFGDCGRDRDAGEWTIVAIGDAAGERDSAWNREHHARLAIARGDAYRRALRARKSLLRRFDRDVAFARRADGEASVAAADRVARVFTRHHHPHAHEAFVAHALRVEHRARDRLLVFVENRAADTGIGNRGERFLRALRRRERDRHAGE